MRYEPSRNVGIDKTFVALGAFLGMLGVILGALGAHLVHVDDSHRIYSIYEIAVRYQFYHALGLIAIGMSMAHLSARGWLRAAGWLMFLGVVLFCGSLYLSTFFAWHAVEIVTPFGGSSFILAWLLYFIGILLSRP